MSRTSIAMMLPLRWWEWSEGKIAGRVRAAAEAVEVVDGAVAAGVGADTTGAVVDTGAMAVTAGMEEDGNFWPVNAGGHRRFELPRMRSVVEMLSPFFECELGAFGSVRLTPRSAQDDSGKE